MSRISIAIVEQSPEGTKPLLSAVQKQLVVDAGKPQVHVAMVTEPPVFVAV